MSRARAIDTADIALERGFVFDRAGNHVRPCLRRGGRDRFSISIRKGAFADIERQIAADRRDCS
jgi:hypothetical protein